MTLSLLADSDEWIVPISTLAQQQAQAAQAEQSTVLGGQHAYCNHLGQAVVDSLLLEARNEAFDSPGDEASPHGSAVVADVTTTVASLQCCEFVPGLALVLEDKRLVVIATESITGDELRVPQEWIDLPNWLGDYYVSIQLLPEALPTGQQAIVLGYATHQQLKQQGQYDAFDRSYSLDRGQLIDWDLFEATYRVYSPEQTRSADLVTLAETVPAALIERLGQSEKLLPRLEVPFAQWGAILNDKAMRQQLKQMRSKEQAGAAAIALSSPTALLGWLQKQFPCGWQDMAVLPSRVLTARSQRSQQSSISVRSKGGATLPEPMQYRTKALSFSSLQPAAATELDQSAELNQTLATEPQIALVVGLATSSEDELKVALSVEPLQENRTAQDIQLRLLDDAGAEIAQVGATTLEHIDMSFTASPGEAFSLEVLSQGQRAVESFLL